MPLPRIALAAVLLALAAPAVASADRLVTPPAPPVPTFQSTGLEMVAFDGYVYFAANDGVVGNELWRSDGTPAGTFALTAGAFDGVTPGHPFAGPPVQLGDKVIFTAQYPHAVGDPVPVGARRIYVLDTSQADETRRATIAPSITGTPAVGQKLTGDKGTWTLEPNSYAYKWLRNGTPIPNATSTTYTPSAADAGTQISFRVTASGIGGPNVVDTDSAPVSVGGVGDTVHAVQAQHRRPAHVRAHPEKEGQAERGGAGGPAHHAEAAGIAQSRTKLTFRWYANGKRIQKQTKSSLKLGKALKGKRITAKITVKRAGYRTLTLTVGPTGKVKGAKR